MSERIVLNPHESLVNAVVDRIPTDRRDFSSIAVVFPGKRPGHFLRRELARRLGGSFIPPRLFSIDEFVQYIFERLNPAPVKDLDAMDAVAILYFVRSIFFFPSASSFLESWKNSVCPAFGKIVFSMRFREFRTITVTRLVNTTTNSSDDWTRGDIQRARCAMRQRRNGWKKSTSESLNRSSLLVSSSSRPQNSASSTT
jgi:hypothetical protein